MKMVIALWLSLYWVNGVAQEKPNILVLWGDDIGQSNISAYTLGVVGYKTPNIDRIADEGAIFTHYYAQQSCTAGRAAFITGQIHHEFFHAVDKYLPEVLAFGRDHADPFDSQTCHHDKKDHNDPAIDDMGIVMCKVPETDQLTQMYKKHIGMFHLKMPP